MCCSFIFVCKKSAQLQNLKAQTSSRVTGVSLCPRILVFMRKGSVRETECVFSCWWMWLEKPWDRKFLSFSFQKKFLCSPVCFFPSYRRLEEKEAEGFEGLQNKKAAGSCAFHTWLMSQWDDVSYQHSAHGSARRKVYWGSQCSNQRRLPLPSHHSFLCSPTCFCGALFSSAVVADAIGPLTRC